MVDIAVDHVRTDMHAKQRDRPACVQFPNLFPVDPLQVRAGEFPSLNPPFAQGNLFRRPASEGRGFVVHGKMIAESKGPGKVLRCFEWNAKILEWG